MVNCFWEKDNNFFGRICVLILFLFFIIALIAGFYGIFLSRQIAQKALNLTEERRTGKITIDYGDRFRVFEGEVSERGMSFLDALMYCSQTGKIKLNFISNSGRLRISGIDGLADNNAGEWRVSFSGMNWEKPLSDIDPQKLFIYGGASASIFYRKH